MKQFLCDQKTIWKQYKVGEHIKTVFSKYLAPPNCMVVDWYSGYYNHVYLFQMRLMKDQHVAIKSEIKSKKCFRTVQIVFFEK